jgi:hypothetical protein
MKDFGSLKNHEPTEIIKNRGRNICFSICGIFVFQYAVHVEKNKNNNNNK